jgi:hypothetical protein
MADTKLFESLVGGIFLLSGLGMIKSTVFKVNFDDKIEQASCPQDCEIVCFFTSYAIIKRAKHYTEAAIDEIKLLEKCVTANPKNPERAFVVELYDWFKHSGPNGVRKINKTILWLKYRCLYGI